MLRKLKKSKAQSTAEYAVLLGLVIAAVVAMQTNVKRGWQARVKVETDQMTNDIINNANWSAVSSTVATTTGDHYEPTKLSRQTHEETVKDTETAKILTGGKTEKSFERTTQQQKDDYQKYEY